MCQSGLRWIPEFASEDASTILSGSSYRQVFSYEAVAFALSAASTLYCMIVFVNATTTFNFCTAAQELHWYEVTIFFGKIFSSAGSW
jgi:hypothetical protein